MPVISWRSPLPYESPLSFRNNGKDSKISMGSFLHGDTMARMLWQNWDGLFLSAVTRLALMQCFCLTATILRMKAGHTTAAPSHKWAKRVKSNGRPQMWLGRVSVTSHIWDVWKLLNLSVNFEIKKKKEVWSFIKRRGWLKSNYLSMQMLWVSPNL